VKELCRCFFNPNGAHCTFLSFFLFLSKHVLSLLSICFLRIIIRVSTFTIGAALLGLGFENYSNYNGIILWNNLESWKLAVQIVKF
jgi:hypothetical protein